MYDSNSCGPVDNIMPLQSSGYNSDTKFETAEGWYLKILEKKYVWVHWKGKESLSKTGSMLVAQCRNHKYRFAREKLVHSTHLN